MKGNKGDQNYDIPENTDLSKFKNVTIWCARFGVNFGQASLAARGKSRSNNFFSTNSSIFT